MPASSDISANQTARAAAISTLAAAPAEVLARLWADWNEVPDHTILRGPETGLVMLRGRTGGGGAPFNLGEASVTRVTIKLKSGEVGHSYALGRDGEKAKCAAIFDALWQRDDRRAEIETRVLAPLSAAQKDADHTHAAQAAATKVEFFTMVRGDD